MCGLGTEKDVIIEIRGVVYEQKSEVSEKTWFLKFHYFQNDKSHFKN